MPKTTQLRTYTVREGRLDEWVERWRAEIMPLRLKLGFTVDGAWVDRERNQFVWLIRRRMRSADHHSRGRSYRGRGPYVEGGRACVGSEII
ncbi:NIPSNAP family protein [Streptomyces sp. CA-210063]|uniref:NIPSNAP family protein n=1 Tax=Streptomyces sp. CA-210063 TaxID=2801029 RepID=UPI00214C9CF1|nr:NIPSNAP family protein [Streptomyces sp. CA-210063]UUU33628.1 NIPSNAP family protein [Streptomyces sp. CA-210063]